MSENSAEQTPSMELPLQASQDDETIPVSKFPPVSVFDKSTTYPAIIVPVKRTAELRKKLSAALLHRPKIKNVYSNPGDDKTRKLVLSGNDALQYEGVQALLSEDGGGCTKDSHTITLTYSDFTVDEILRQVLPSVISELPAAFEIVGSIAHLNLRDDVLPYKYIVGKVIMDKNSPRIQTVVNKLGTIANEYRTFGMEVIAGRDGPNWSLAKVKEEGCEFTLDFQHVYWNSRLGAEHKRMVHLIQKDAQMQQHPIIVADLMAGVGPFAVPLTACLPTKGKKKSRVISVVGTPASSIVVHANDLNPSSFKYLKMNAEKNKCPADKLSCYNMDARAFCHLLQDQKKEDGGQQPNPVDFHHVIMNLPASAPEFLDAFRGFTNPTLPRMHVYCFAPKPATASSQNSNTDSAGRQQEDIDAGVRNRCSAALGCPLDAASHDVVIRIVRDVSPKKNMVCVSFTLPQEVRKLPRIAVEARIGGADNGKDQAQQEDEVDEEPKLKRPKTSD